MRWLRAGLSLRVKIMASFVLIVIGGTLVSTLIGSRIITNALLSQARIRVQYGLEAARMVYEDRLKGVTGALSRTAVSEPLLGALRHGPSAQLSEALGAARDLRGLDFIGYVDATAHRVHRPLASSPNPLEPGPIVDAVEAALSGRARSSTEELPQEQLTPEGEGLAARAHIDVVASPFSEPDSRTQVSSGLTLLAAVPVQDRGRLVGALYGGVLLNGNHEIVDQVKKLVYGGEQYQGRDVGTASIFLRDVRVSTNVLTDGGARAIGTRASAEVTHQVLELAQPWYGRAFVVNGWYVAAYEPVRKANGEVLGMLYVGMPESPFLAVRTDVMLTFLFVALAGMAVVLVLTYVMTRSMIHPLEDIVAATKKIAGGDLNLTVAVTSRDEIGHLATSFNRMLQSLRAMQEELQQWGHTLEEKVRERSEELVAVQARMTQSEKLASIGRLAAGVAHEINNPLGGILSLAMLGLEEGGPENPLRGDLEIIVKQTLRCREIVKGLLDFARQSEMRPTRTDVNAIVDNTLKLLERQAIFHNIKTVRQFREPLPAVLIDPGQMQEVVMNIVINAVDAMEENGELTIETEVDERTIEVVVRIRDTGSGIPNDVMPFIFEPFFTTKKVGKGTGLGLAIVHGIVTRAGGRVEVKSSHEGTTFTVRLPIATEEAEHVERESVGAGPG